MLEGLVAVAKVRGGYPQAHLNTKSFEVAHLS